MYSVLGTEECKALRVERVRTLEAEHYRIVLQLAELEAVSGEDAAARSVELHTELSELQRRVMMHASCLGLEMGSRHTLDATGNNNTDGNDGEHTMGET